MSRSLAFIAVGAAVAVAAAVVAVGVASGESSGASTGSSSYAPGSGQLPAGHPSITATAASTAVPETGSRVQRTIARLEKASASQPNDLQLLLDLGDAYFQGQRMRQAGHAFARVLLADPGNELARVRLAMVWHAQGQSDRAAKALNAVIAADPKQQEAHYSMAIVDFSLGKVDDARVQWKTAADLDPSTTIGRRSQSFVDLLADHQSAAPSSGQ